MSDSFIDDMRQQVAEALTPGSTTKENPLRTIGLSEQILEIGLSDDELYDYCKYQARYLTAQFHRDRPEMRTPEAEEKQHRFEEAFNLIKMDRVAFDKALAEFRKLKSVERSSMNFTRQSLNVTRERLRDYQDKELAFNLGREQFESERATIEARDRQRQASFEALSLEMQLGRERVRSLEELALRRRKYNEHLMRYLSALSIGHDWSGIHAFDVRWVAIASYAPLRAQPKGQFRAKVLREVLGSLNLDPSDIRSLKAGWADAVQRFGSVQLGESRIQYNLVLSVFALSSGRATLLYGWQQAIRGGRVLGSIKPSKIEIDVRRMTHIVPRSMMIELFTPFIKSGDLLVSEYRQNIPGQERELTRLRFETKNLVLGIR